jgi:hypothetical protein
MRSTTPAPYALAFCLAAAITACSEVEPGERPNVANARRGVEAELVVSDIAPKPGSDVVLLLRMRLGADVSPIASFTARVAYDTTRLRLLGEAPLDQAATRMINPAAGEARVAGIAANGFTDGQLVALQFKTLQHNGLATLQVAFDELHGLDGRSFQETVRVLATLVPRGLQ